MAVAVLGLALPSQASAQDVVIFAAASLQTALDDVAAAWAEQTGGSTAIAYAGSPALARQIEAGAPADVFVSADTDWMDYLAARDLIDADTRTDLVGNRIVLIASGRDAAPREIVPGMDLAGLLGGERLAMADVQAVPAGRYGKAALISLGVWDSVADRLAQTENVRAALALVAQGEAPFGIVYATDAVAENRVTVVGTFPEGSHPRIVYPAALTADSDHALAGDFLGYLGSDTARGLFEAQGFTLIDGPDADAHAR